MYLCWFYAYNLWQLTNVFSNGMPTLFQLSYIGWVETTACTYMYILNSNGYSTICCSYELYLHLWLISNCLNHFYHNAMSTNQHNYHRTIQEKLSSINPIILFYLDLFIQKKLDLIERLHTIYRSRTSKSCTQTISFVWIVMASTFNIQILIEYKEKHRFSFGRSNQW